MDRQIAISKEGNSAKEKAYMEIAGLTSSYHEHDIFEKIDGFSSVSAVRALQTAKQNGISIYQINSTNIGQNLPLLQIGSEIKTDIQNAVNAGKEVMISQTNIQINDWNGVGYIVRNPNTGSGAYMISGGLAGGGSTSKADGNQIVELFKGAYAWIKDKLDPQTRSTIVLAAQLEIGEKIAEAANELVGEGYEDVKQCSGLVRKAYWAAGICLDEWAGCGENLVKKYGITGTNGVSYHYNLANTLKINNSVRTTNDPLLGDIVFFDNTTGTGRPLSHEGIVVSAPNATGMVRFIHAISDGVTPDKMNILNPDNRDENSFIGDPNRCGNTCRSGQLFSGYGTVRNQ